MVIATHNSAVSVYEPFAASYESREYLFVARKP
jgi:hypothetical protein